MSEQINTLYAISPIDGRYQSKTAELGPYLSEFGLIKYRVQVEIEYLIKLSTSGIHAVSALLDKSKQEALRNIYQNFSLTDAETIKATESITNHDVKAVEYFVKDALDKIGMSDIKENKLEYKTNVTFSLQGDYDISIQQAMRKTRDIEGLSYLGGITDVGLQIEKAK